MGDILAYGKQNISKEDLSYVLEALKNDFLTQGPLVERFEQDLASYLNSKHVVVVSNGTAALHIASLALDLRPGDAVIIPAISFVATSNSVLYCGAIPVFADVDSTTGNISIESAENAYHLAKSKGLNVKAIYPVHFSGFPCESNEILEFANKYNLKIVEDACHSLGAQYRKAEQDDFSMVGSFADMAVWSFHPVKHITTGEGGAVSTNDDKLARKLRLFRSHGISKDPTTFVINEQAIDDVTLEVNPWYHEMHCLGFNYRLPDILCALGVSQLKRLPEFIRKRKEIASYYKEELASIYCLKIPNHNSKNSISSYHLFSVLIDFKALKLSRKQVMEKLRLKGVGSQVHYIPIPCQPYYRNNQDKFLSTPIPNAVKFYESELSIPMYYDLTENNLETVVAAFKGLCQ